MRSIQTWISLGFSIVVLLLALFATVLGTRGDGLYAEPGRPDAAPAVSIVHRG